MLEQAQAAAKKAEAARVAGTKPSLDLPNYEGTYRNELYGDVKVTNENGKLRVQFGPAFSGDLEHWNYDTFQAKFADGAVVSKTLISFTLSPQGKADTVILNMPGVTAYPFKRVAEPAKNVAAAATANRN